MSLLSILLILCCGIMIGSYLPLGKQKTSLPFSSEVLIVVTVPEEHADAVRQAIGQAGGGQVGKYTFCSFSYKGIGRFLPQKGARPTIGKVGSLETVYEETIQVPCSLELLDKVVSAVKHVHPYEEPGIDIMPLYYYGKKKMGS